MESVSQNEVNSEPRPSDEVEARLGAALYEEMEHLDPTDGRSYHELSDRERDFYRYSIRSLLEVQADLLLAAIDRLKASRL